MRRRHLLAVLAVSLLANCAAPTTDEQARGRPATAARPRITLADSIPYGDGMVEGHLHRVVVAWRGRRDTVPGVLVTDPPVLGPDGQVYGIRYQEELALGVFAYDVEARRVRMLPRPEGWWESTAPRLAPDGRHVAFLAYGADGTGHAAVAALPEGRVVYRGPSAVLLETGAGVDDIRWLAPARFEIRVYMGGATGGIQRMRGTLDPLAVQVDTLSDTG